jgi:hypothetical protein
MQLGIRGIANVSPSIATRESFVAIAWTAGVPAGRGHVYVVTSSDDGATFSAPVNIGETQVDADNPPVVVFEWPRMDERQRFVMPDIRVEWTFHEGGRVVQRAARSTDHGRTFARDPDDRVQLFYTGGPEVAPPAIDGVIGKADQERGVVGHPRLVPQEDGTMVTVWDETHGAARRVMFRRVLLGARDSVQTMDAFALSASTPAVAPVAGNVQGGVVVAWTSGERSPSVIAVRRVGLDALCSDGPVRLEYQAFGHSGHD